MLSILISGVINGGAYALLAVGISLIFGVSNLINFAQGSVFAVGALAGWWLIAREHWPLWAAVIGVVVFTGLLGLVINVLAVQPLADAPPIAALLSTFAVSIILENTAQFVFSPDTRRFPQLLSSDDFQVAGVRFGTLHIVILSITAAVIVALAVFLRYHRLGQAIRATAQDRDAAAQMGIPVRAVENIAFVLASGLGGLAGVFVGMYVSNVNPTIGDTAVFEAFTAATLGGLGSMPGAIVGGILLGIAEAFGIAQWGDGARQLITFVVLIAVLWLRPSGLLGKARTLAVEPMTGTFFGLGTPYRLRRWQASLLIVFAVAVVPFLFSDYVLEVGTQILVFAILALSLTLLTGNAGQMSLGQAGPLALGAYCSALLTTRVGLGFWPSLLVSGLVAAVVSVVLVSPSWRLRGHYVAIATLGTGAMITAFILNAGWLTNGPQGISGIPQPAILGFRFEAPATYYLLDLAILLLVIGVVRRLQNSPLGNVLAAIREDEIAVRSAGVNAASYKSLAFAVGGFFAGIAGSLQAHQYGYIDPTMFNTQTSLLAVTIVVLGGISSPLGVLLGSAVLVGVPEFFRGLQDYRMLVYGVVLVSLIRFRPQGLLGRKAA
jgi:branched-chain amino acid transport system permease protein